MNVSEKLSATVGMACMYMGCDQSFKKEEEKEVI